MLFLLHLAANVDLPFIRGERCSWKVLYWWFNKAATKTASGGTKMSVIPNRTGVTDIIQLSLW